MTLKESWKDADIYDKGFIVGFIILVAVLAVLGLTLFAYFISWAISSIGVGTV